jgi:hypothetical protein
MGHDATGLLPAMLQRMQAKGDEIGGVIHADHAKDAAFFLQLIAVIEGRKRVGGEAAHGLSES